MLCYDGEMRNCKTQRHTVLRNNGMGIIAVMSAPRSVESRNGNYKKVKTPARLPDETKEI
jgi:hypothetical protein